MSTTADAPSVPQTPAAEVAKEEVIVQETAKPVKAEIPKGPLGEVIQILLSVGEKAKQSTANRASILNIVAETKLADAWARLTAHVDQTVPENKRGIYFENAGHSEVRHSPEGSCLVHTGVGGRRLRESVGSIARNEVASELGKLLGTVDAGTVVAARDALNAYTNYNPISQNK